MSKNTVVLIRGISGAGKSTYVKKHFPDAVVCSADHHFEDKEGGYNFDPRKLGAAHGSCKRKFAEALQRKEPLVVVDNTNTKMKEMTPYYKAAKAAGYEVRVVRLVVDPEVAASRNVHNVPEEVVKRMQARFADTPPEWGEKIVSTA